MTPAFTPVSIGPVAAEIVAQPGDVEVAAMFDRSFYLLSPHGFITVGVAALGNGPINLLVTAEGEIPDWPRHGVTREAKGAIETGGLTIGDSFALPLSNIPPWHPPAWPVVDRARIEAGLGALRPAAAASCPSEGLSQLIIAGKLDKTNHSALAAKVPIDDLVRHLPNALSSGTVDEACARAATLLLGLGPGLTPSGDDVLGGLFLALSALGATGVRDALWDVLARELDDLTVGISAAHLAAAADGMGAAVVHDMFNAVLCGDAAALPRLLVQLGRIGHSSGYDSLAGIVLTLDAALTGGIVG